MAASMSMQGHSTRSWAAMSAPRSVHALASRSTFASGSGVATLRKAVYSRRRKTHLQVQCTVAENGPIIYKDEDKEAARKYRRTVFDHPNWEQHRSTSRYSRHLITILGSRVVRGLAIPVLTISAISTAVVVYESSLQAGLLPSYFRTLAVDTKAAGSMTSFALSLLLVFRTNASYQRWDEARKLWGGVVNRTRDLARQGLTYFANETTEDKALIAALERWTIAFPKSLMFHLRSDVDLRRELERRDSLLVCIQNVLEPEELDRLMASKHRPNYVTRVLATIVRKARIPDVNVFRMEDNITFFADAIGGCERIFRSPVPLSWTRHTSRFLMIWLGSVPFTLYDSCKWATVPAAAIIAFLLLGIEEIGVSIEEPFSILPLEVITDTIKTNVIEMGAKLDDVEDLVGSVTTTTAADGNNGTGAKLPSAAPSSAAPPTSQIGKRIWPA